MYISAFFLHILKNCTSGSLNLLLVVNTVVHI